MEEKELSITYLNQEFNTFICSHNHTYIYVLKDQKYEPTIQLCIDKKNFTMNVKKYPSYPNKVIMSTMVYNEDNYIRQWISFHKSLGVEHFIIYDNSKLDDKRSYKSIEKSSNLPNVLHDFISDGIVLLINWPYPKRMKKSGISGQTTQQCHSLWAFRESKYIGFFDIDEYVNMQHHKSIPELLDNETANVVKDIGSVALCNKDFYNPINKPTDGFNFLKIYNCNNVILDKRHKHFVIPKNVYAFSVHEITLGKPMHIIDVQKVYFNHYFFLNKKNRGTNKTSFEDTTIEYHSKYFFEKQNYSNENHNVCSRQ